MVFSNSADYLILIYSMNRRVHPNYSYFRQALQYILNCNSTICGKQYFVVCVFNVPLLGRQRL